MVAIAQQTVHKAPDRVKDFTNYRAAMRALFVHFDHLIRLVAADITGY
jgi:hypothetical protein